MARKSRFAVEIANLKEMRLRFSAIGKAVNGDNATVYQRISGGITEAYKTAALLVRNKARANAQSSGTPKRLYSGSRPAIFAFLDFDATRDKRRQRSTLVGVRTGAPPRKDDRLYVEWGQKGNGLKGMSLARIFESGTRRGIKPRRFFRSAVFATKSRVLTILADAYKTAVDKFNREK